jgi:uncharacterized protein YbcC (UPF0753/DUF2309 family)
MDSGMLTSDYENTDYIPTISWQNLIDAACKQACDAIAPSWPLDSSIAVNPYWKRINRPLREVAARMAALGNISVFPTRDYIKHAWQSGRIQPQDLNYAIENLPAARAAFIDENDCINALRTPINIPHLPLLIDVLDDDPQRHTRLSWRQAITHQVSQTCAAYFDINQAEWHPDRKNGLYAFWRETLTHDHGIGILMGLPDLGEQLDALPATAVEAEQWVMQRLNLPESAWADYLESVLLTVNGWASWCAYLNWQAELQGKHDPNLRELLAIRLAWGAILLQCKDDMATRHAFAALQEKWAHTADSLKQAEQVLLPDEIWQFALDAGYQRKLAASLANKKITVENKLPEVQAAFCIDVRSEPLRRALEETHPNMQTIGFAGFFGLPMSYSPLGTTLKRPQLPGLLAPTMEVTEQICTLGCSEEKSDILTKMAIEARQQVLNRSSQWESGSRWPSATFSFVEAAGLGYLSKLKHWIRPSHKARINNDQTGVPKKYRIATRPKLLISTEQKVALTAQVLRALGLDRNIAPLVLLVGHGSQSDNNAHAAALDCGACCGQTGEVNARVLAQLLNDSAVRDGLQGQGIHIPTNTIFVAALHNTTTDEVEGFDLDLLPKEKYALWTKLEPALYAAGDMVRRERAADVDIHPAADHATLLKTMRRRANDGAQTRPEWGLADNAAFIIAPRQRTKHLNLDGRSFLHDYDSAKDRDDSLLEMLMTAPMLVTHWINLQYHASTCDPLHMGCGNKVLHNVVGGHIGVFEGNGGDLRIGLSKQSLHNGKQWMHEPVRLTVLIEAPATSIERIINKHSVVRQLVENGWLHLWRYEENALMRYLNGRWANLSFNDSDADI